MGKKSTHIEGGPRPGKRILRRILKGLAWIASIWLLILAVLQFALTPSTLAGIVERFAGEYIDGELSFSEVRMTAFRHFPNIGIAMDDCSITYPAERYDSLKANGAQGMLLKAGQGETRDTLASFRHFSAGINIPALLTGKISIPHVILSKPRIYAHSYDQGNANWNIFRTSPQQDTATTSLPPLSIGKIRLVEHPRIIYTDSQNTIFAILDFKRMDFNGRLDTRTLSRTKVAFNIDSLILAGRIAKDTVGFRLNRLHIEEMDKEFRLQANANATLATSSFGRIAIPIDIEGAASIIRDSVPTLSVNGLRADIAGIPIHADGQLIRSDDSTIINGEFGIDGCRIEEIAGGFIKTLIPEAEKITTDATISLHGKCKGAIGNGVIPEAELTMSIPESTIWYEGVRQPLYLVIEAKAATDSLSRINMDIDHFRAGTDGLEIYADGGAGDLLGKDPLFKINGSIDASFDRLSSLIPKKGLDASGDFKARLEGSLLKSQLSIYNFAGADLTGSITGKGIRLDSTEDSLSMKVDGLDIKIGHEEKSSRRDPSKKFKLLAVSGQVKDAKAEYGQDLSFTGKDIDFGAKNSIDAFSDRDTSKVHPFSGHISAGSLAVSDGSSMSLAMNDTKNQFMMMPKPGHPEIPILTLSSSNKRILMRDVSNRLILTDADLKGKAAMNTIERRQRMRSMIDSLSVLYPSVQRDSLLRHHIRQMGDREIPEWMKEKDFRRQDINIRLDESLARYFREWDINGDLDVRTGILMTPYFPMRNILRGMDISVSNDEVRIDSLKFVSGTSEISAKGSLSGLRRALLGRGTYNLDLDVTSGKMDADALLAAFNAGMNFTPAESSEAMSDASDSEFLKMVVADTLTTGTSQTLLVIPANVNAEISLDARNISYTGLEIAHSSSDILIKERCMQILNTSVTTNVGNGTFEGFYATRSKKDIRTGFNLDLKDITTEKVIAMMPAIDTIMPLLKSFKGLVNCELAATASLDTAMNIVLPSINGVIRICGENLSMSEDKMFTDLARKLKFKNRKEGKIDKMKVEGVIKDNTLEVFPFIVDIDRYTLALSGKHNLDQSFRYHVSVIRSPMLFKLGVDLYGQDFEKMKFKIGKPKYRNTDVPAFTEVIDRTKNNLAESIKGIFLKGVNAAIFENEQLEEIARHKKDIEYINAVDQQLEELSDDERRQLEETEENGSENISTETNKETPIH